MDRIPDKKCKSCSGLGMISPVPHHLIGCISPCEDCYVVRAIRFVIHDIRTAAFLDLATVTECSAPYRITRNVLDDMIDGSPLRMLLEDVYRLSSDHFWCWWDDRRVYFSSVYPTPNEMTNMEQIARTAVCSSIFDEYDGEYDHDAGYSPRCELHTGHGGMHSVLYPYLGLPNAELSTQQLLEWR